MASVVSLGSANVDHVAAVDEERLAALADRHGWFPAAGETVAVDAVPADLRALDAVTRPGGKGANQAVAAARAGADATLLGTVGPDADDAGLLASLSGAGVDVSRLGRADAPTGTAHVLLDDAGENRIVVTAGANAALDAAYVDAHREAIRGADVLALQNEVPAGPVAGLLADLADAGDRPTVLLDPAPADGDAAALLRAGPVDVATPNEVEARALADALAGFDGTVVRTRGPDDVVVDEPDGGRFRLAPPSVEPVDTTGAGDAFAGFLAARLAAGDGLREAVETAAVAGALSVTADGVQSATPTVAEVRRAGGR